MKKYIISGIAVLAIAAVATINITLSNGKINALSDLQLANVEALAQESAEQIYCNKAFQDETCVIINQTAIKGRRHS